MNKYMKQTSLKTISTGVIFQLFPNRRGDSVSVSIQFRETQHSLEHEREKNSILRHQISVLKDELNQAKTEGNGALP